MTTFAKMFPTRHETLVANTRIILVNPRIERILYSMPFKIAGMPSFRGSGKGEYMMPVHTATYIANSTHYFSLI